MALTALPEKVNYATPRTEFIAGIKAISPILLGVIPFATISGIAAVEIGFSTQLALTMSFIVFAGASQLAVLQLIGVSASTLVILLTAFIINLRFAMYSASIGPHFKGLSLKWRSVLAYLLTDQAYAVSITRFDNGLKEHKHWFYLGAALAMWGTWQGSTMAGVFLGTQVPESWSLDFAIPLTFIALAAPLVKGRAAVAAALTAGLIAVVATRLPFNSNLIVAAVLGILVGVLVEWRQKKETEL